MHFNAWKSVIIIRFSLKNFKHEQYYPNTGINNDKLPSPSNMYINFF